MATKTPAINVFNGKLPLFLLFRTVAISVAHKATKDAPVNIYHIITPHIIKNDIEIISQKPISVNCSLKEDIYKKDYGNP